MAKKHQDEIDPVTSLGAIANLAAAWLITEVSETIFPMFGYGDTPARISVILLTIGFPLFLIFSWALSEPMRASSLLC